MDFLSAGIRSYQSPGNDPPELTIDRSTISNNSAGFGGGGIHTMEGPFNITDSTVSNNFTTLSFAAGGGIFISQLSNAQLTNVTISGNSAESQGGSGIFLDFPSTIASNTTSGPGGGIRVIGDISLKNTIVANNTPDDCSKHAAATITSFDHNLSSDDSCLFTATSDLTNTDPLLDLLAKNGGTTFTHALRPGSPAIEAGNPDVPGSGGDACDANDQRGVTRFQGVLCDIGAYEEARRTRWTLQREHRRLP